MFFFHIWVSVLLTLILFGFVAWGVGFASKKESDREDAFSFFKFFCYLSFAWWTLGIFMVIASAINFLLFDKPIFDV